jgi:DNA invertase Pin-like site-specific DNA recombinase
MSKVVGTSGHAIGLDRRSDAVARFADAYGYELVWVAEDTDVSGSTDPFTRPALGAWLARPDDFDVILASDLDRVGRNARHLTRLRDWCEDTGHRLIVLSPHLEWPPADGDLASPIIWDLLGRLAEYELRTITARNRETREWLESHGALARKAPYGYRVTGERGHKALEVDPVTGPAVREAATRYLAGETLDAIARDFNRRGVPSRNRPDKRFDGPRWHRNNIGRLLRDMSICGRLQQGQHVLRYEPLVSVAEHNALVDRLDSRTHHRGPREVNREMLTSVLICGYCGKGMHPIWSGRGHRYRYYYCRNADCPETPRLMLPLISTDAEAAGQVMKMLGDTPVMRHEVIPGHDWEDDINQLKLDLANLDLESPDWDDRLAGIRAEIAELRAQPVTPARRVSVPTGDYVADVFLDADAETRRETMMHAGVRFIASRDGLKLDVATSERKKNA